MRISQLENKLRKHAETTKSVMQASFDLNEAIKNMEANSMNKAKSRMTMKRTLAIAAVLALSFVTVTLTPLASSIRGFFSDIVRFDGTITGTQYENATNDIKVSILELTSENDNIIPLELTFENPTEAPFPYIQGVSVAEYKIFDSTNKEIVKVKLSAEDGDKGTVSDGKVQVNLSLNDEKLISGEEYTIVIEKMYGLSKADAPLHITGTWRCKFTK